MRIRLLALALTSGLMFVCLGTTAQAVVPARTLKQLTDDSTLIVRGKVTAVEGRWGRLGTIGPVILSRIEVQVIDLWKGASPGKVVEVTVLGGTVLDDKGDDAFQWCADSPSFQVGEEVLAFLRRKDGALWCCGWLQGKYRIESLGRDNETTRTVVNGRPGSPLSTREDLETVRTRVLGHVRSGATSASGLTPSGLSPSGANEGGRQ